jgi:hypothetical protein
MVPNSFGPYHGLWHKDAQTKCIDVTPTSGAMTHTLGLGILAPQPKIYHAYGTAIFHYFSFADIKSVDNNNMALDQVINPYTCLNSILFFPCCCSDFRGCCCFQFSVIVAVAVATLSLLSPSQLPLPLPLPLLLPLPLPSP